MRVKTTIWTAAAVATLAVLPVVGASAALADTAAPGASSSTSTSTGAATPRLARACGRIPRRIERVEKLQARFAAGADTLGSIAYLSARIDAANAAGRTDVVRVLSDRLAIRKDINSQLSDILAKLQDAQQVCQTHQSASPQASS